MRDSRRALTLPELVVGFAVFSFIMILLAVSMSGGTAVWERSFGSNTAQVELRKAYSSLQPDLLRTELQTVRRTVSTSSFSGSDGDAVWFLSPWDETSSNLLRTSSGRPLWQRNILYYCTVPKQHDELYGATCTGSADGQGYEMGCPHKVLVRKVINNPAGSGEAEELLAPGRLANYLTRPRRLDLPSGEPGLEEATIVATGLVTFQLRRDPTAESPGEVAVRLAAMRPEMARRQKRAGNGSTDEALRELHFSVFPPEGATP